MTTASLRRNYSWTLAGSVVYTLCQWGQLIMLTKLGTPEVVGQHALALAITAPVFLFFGMDMRAVQATDAQQEFTFQNCLGLRILTTVAAWALIAVGVSIWGASHPATSQIILVVALAKSFEALSDTCFGALQRRERLDLIGRSQIIQGALTLIVMTVTMYLTRELLWAVTAMAGVWALMLFSYDLPNVRRVLELVSGSSGQTRLRPHWQSAPLRQLVTISLPLGFVRLLASLDYTVPRYFLQYWFGESQVGLYSAMAYVMIAGNRVVAPIGDTLTPRVANHFRDRDERWLWVVLWRVLAFAVLLGAITIVFSVLWGRQFLTLVYRAEYAEGYTVFVYLMVAASIGYLSIFLRSFINASRSFRIQLILSLTVSAVLIVACCVWIPTYGSIGAAWAVVAGAVTSVLAGGVMLAAVWKRRIAVNRVVLQGQPTI